MRDRKKILIIDDEYLTLAIMEDILKPLGYQIMSASQASSGFQEAIHGHPDLIFLDIILPDKDGFTLLAELKRHERTKNIPVVLISALSRSSSIAAAEAAAFIHKPIVEADVVAVIRDTIGPPER